MKSLAMCVSMLLDYGQDDLSEFSPGPSEQVSPNRSAHLAFWPLQVDIAHSNGSDYDLSVRLTRTVRKIGFVAVAASIFILPQDAHARIGVVKVVLGSCAVLRGAQRIPLVVGFRLDKGDRVITGADRRLGITFDDNSRASIGPKSNISFAEFAYNATTRQGRFVTNVDRGALAFVSGDIARSSRRAMRVKTPQRLLGVIGTRFVVVVE